MEAVTKMDKKQTIKHRVHPVKMLSLPKAVNAFR
jgi:hypothetical protein